MKLREFAQIIDRLMAHPGNAESDVVILRSDPAVGPHANTAIKNVGAGFDWDKGKILIFPEQLLYLQNDVDQIKALRHTIDGLTWDLNSEKRERRRLAGKVRELIPLLDQNKVDDELLRKLGEVDAPNVDS